MPVVADFILIEKWTKFYICPGDLSVSRMSSFIDCSERCIEVGFLVSHSQQQAEEPVKEPVDHIRVFGKLCLAFLERILLHNGQGKSLAGFGLGTSWLRN
jgi:hypothetical protein